jgi:DNA anti-recombination protein RmuC
VKARLRSLLIRARDRALAPMTERLDAISGETSRRLDELAERVGDLEVLLQVIDGRAATITERSVSQEESRARLARRVEEIERLLGPPG